MDVEPRLDRPNTGNLDGPPPSPSMKRARTMLDRSEPDGGEGLGAMAGTPQAKALAGMKMVQQGTQQIVLVIPALAQQLGDFLNQLQMVTVNAVAGMSQGGAPGMAPMPAPPPPMPQMPPPQAAPAPTPGIPGM